jgi:hypothetical protein
MILAGIGEAGYGPILGPLSVASCAMRLPSGGDLLSDPPPCAWKLLRRCVARKRDRKGRKLQINDSKQVYSPAMGLMELERAVLAWNLAAGGRAADLERLLEEVAPSVLPDLRGVDWYRPADDERHPLVAEAASVAISANALRQECRAKGIELLPARARLLLEGPFNRMTAATRNKSSVLFSLAASHIDHLLGAHAAEGLVIICDRHGGRSHYAPLLRLMFAEWDLTVLSETEGRADYVLRRGTARARLVFAEKAEAACLPTAMASMVAKYLRERLMERFNAFWRRHEPELKPTAGYWNDGLRFLGDIGPIRRKLRIEDSRLIRQR